MKSFVLASLFMLIFAASAVQAGGSQAAGRLVPAHSHWDGPNGNFELKACYAPSGKAVGAASTIAYLPFRAQNAKSYMQLSLTTGGYVLQRRVSGTITMLKPDISPARLSFGVGSEIMFDLVASGADYTLYDLNPDLSRGRKLYHWRDTTYARGSYISYYTQPRWAGTWDFVHAIPSDSSTVKHDITHLVQDARDHPADGNATTFDSSLPASGGQSGIRGTQQTFGLPSGPNYLYHFTVTGSGTGHVDFRDPLSASGTFFAAGYYRLNLGRGAPTIQQIDGASSVAATYRGAGSGPGTYVLTLSGGNLDLTQAGKLLLHVDDGGPHWGARLRVVPARGQTWSWTGEVIP